MKCKHGIETPVWSPKLRRYVDTCAVCVGPVRVPKANRTPPAYLFDTKKERNTTSSHGMWSVPTKLGIFTICGGCLDLAASPFEAKMEKTTKLVAYIRTSLCKDCGDIYVEDEICPKTLNEHRRKWLVRAQKVPACPSCAGMESIEVDMDELVKDEKGRMVRQTNALSTWRAYFAQRGLL